MVRRLYISHDANGTPGAALLVDYLEEAIAELSGHIACTSLPGYAAAAGGPALDASDAALVIGVLHGSPGAVVTHELLAALDEAVPCMLVQLSDAAPDTGTLPNLCRLRATPSDLATLAEDAAHLLERSLRMTGEARMQIGELMEHASESEGEPAPPGSPGPSGPPRAVSQPPRPPSAPPRTSMVVPKRVWPTYLQAAEAGFHMGASLFDDHNPFERKTHAGNRTSFDECLECLGADRGLLENLHDPELWQCAFENLLERLPVSESKVGHWYEVGFQAVLLCRLSTARPTGGERAERELAQDRRRAWDALCQSAFLVHIESDELGEIGGMLHELTGPAPDPSNVDRCLERVRARARRLQHRGSARDSQPPAVAASNE